jgi:hypothetical protein
MGYKSNVEIITKDIEELQKIVSNLQNYSSIPRIEVDLALGKMQNIYELLLLLRDGRQSNAEKQLQKSPPSHEHEELSAELKNKENKPPDSPHLSDSKKDEVLEISEEPIAEEKNTPVKEEVQKTPKENNQEKSSIQKDKILAEKFEKPGEFVNEKIGVGAAGKDLSTKIQATPIKSISGSLGINDKFYFIRELFNGNADNFRSTLQILDEASNFNEAYNYLLNTFEWNMDSDTVQQLLTLIRRKFISPKDE